MRLGAHPTLGHSQAGFCNGGILAYVESLGRREAMRKIL